LAKEQKPRGRPKDLEKRAAILRTAHKLFFERGLGSVTIDEVSDEAGVSKMTVYSNFEDKEAIFKAVVSQQAAKMEKNFERLQIGAGSIDAILTSYGNALLGFLLSPELMRLEQILSAEMNEHVDLGRRFYQAGPGRIWATVSTTIEAATKSGELQADAPQRAAEDLISLWLGMIPLQYRFHELASVSEAKISERVNHGVSVFMKIYGIAK
jgi:TetR/AcrR family transcriptional regulator, mexJK operon transcriptional repressor